MQFRALGVKHLKYCVESGRIVSDPVVQGLQQTSCLVLRRLESLQDSVPAVIRDELFGEKSRSKGAQITLKTDL